MNDSPPLAYQFGAFRLEPAKRLLLVDSQPVSLPPKAFDLLMVLATHPGRVVTKEELVSAVWPDTAVEEGNLTVAMSALRRALGDDAKEPGIILTIKGRGYQFAAEVHTAVDEKPVVLLAGGALTSLPAEQVLSDEPSRPAQALPDVTRRPWMRPRRVGLVLGGVALVVAGLVTQSRRGEVKPPVRSPAPLARSIAVLPFKSLTPGTGDPGLELGIADALITRLGAIRSINVRPTSAILKYAPLTIDPVQAARDLQVETILDGRIQRTGDKMRVTAQLVRSDDAAVLWAETFDVDVGDIFEVQDSISKRVASTLAPHLSPEESTRVATPETTSFEAYELYLQGRMHLARFTESDVQRAIQYFQQAVQKDPSMALAHVGVSTGYVVLGLVEQTLGGFSPEEIRDKAAAAARAAVERGPKLAEALAVSAAVACMAYEWDRCTHEFESAIEANPSLALAHSAYAIALMSRERTAEALAEIDKALTLDPLSSAYGTNRGAILFRARRFDDAIAQLRTVLNPDPSFRRAWYIMGLALEQKRRWTDAADALKRATEGGPDRVLALAGLGHLAAIAGRTEQAREVLAKLEALSVQRYVPPFYVAIVHTGLGDKEQAFRWLERAYDERSPSLQLLRAEPRLDPLRQDPRFSALLSRVGLGS